MSRRCSIKKLFSIISQYSQKNTCVGVFFNKDADLRAGNFIKKRLQHRCLLVNIAKFLRTSVNGCFWEFLLLCQFERSSTWTNNIASYIGGEEGIFSKTKQKKPLRKLTRWKKLAFTWYSLSFRFSLFLHCTSSGVCPT